MDSSLWSILLGTGGMLTPIVIAAWSRDRSMMTMIQSTRTDWQVSVASAKDDCRKMLDTGMGGVHERINRVRDEYVRQVDLDSHMGRYDKQFDDVRSEMRRNSDAMNKRLDDIMGLLQKP